MSRVLYFDFETTPIVGWGWQMWNKGAAFFHVMQDVQIMSVAWTWSDDPKIYCMSLPDFKGYRPGIFNVNDKKLVKAFMEVFQKADYVVAQNGFGFDFTLWRTRLLIHGLQPHHEPKELDPKRWASKFKLTSKSQDNISRQLGTTMKMETGKKLHYRCLELGDPRAWKENNDYNKQDVKGLRENAVKMAPFIPNLPNANVIRGSQMDCTNPLCPDPTFGMQRRGSRQKSNMSVVQTYQCRACGKYATGPSIQTGVILR